MTAAFGGAESVLVINPNSSLAVTGMIDACCDRFRRDGSPAIECVTLPDGPPSIESQGDVEGVVLPLCRYVSSRPAAAAYVVACYSDPGIDALREIAPGRIFGIAHCALSMATAVADRFGIISMSRRSVARHRRHMRAMGLDARCAGDVAVDVTMEELVGDPAVVERLTRVGLTLRETHGADVIITACAGMSAHRARLEAAVGIPVLDPVAAGVGMAVATVLSRTPARWSSYA
jgi:Asp/Glu/hydantoin racemase